MPDLRAFVAVDHLDQASFHGPYDFSTERRRIDYYEDLDTCEGHSGEDVIELIKRPTGWEHIGPHPGVMIGE